MAEAATFDIRGFQKGMTTYLNQLKGIVQGISAAATGAAVGTTVASNVGLAVAFFQMMVSGIVEAELAKQFNDKLISFQGSQIQQLFEINQQQEQVARETLTNKLAAEKAIAEKQIDKAKYINLIAAIVVVAVVVAILFLIFPKRK